MTWDLLTPKTPRAHHAQRYRIGEGWVAIVNTLGLPKNSPFRDPEQIPYPEPLLPSPVQDPAHSKEEDSLILRELVEEIDSNAKVIELDIPSNPTIGEGQTPPSNLPNPNPQMAKMHLPALPSISKTSKPKT